MTVPQPKLSAIYNVPLFVLCLSLEFSKVLSSFPISAQGNFYSAVMCTPPNICSTLEMSGWSQITEMFQQKNEENSGKLKEKSFAFSKVSVCFPYLAKL